MSSEILQFTEKPLVDESIQEYEYHEYEPQARTNLNSAGEIVVNIELQDLFTHPCESYLVFDGRLTKNDGTAYANADAVALANNGIMYLFSNISYRLSNQEIESVHHPGQATTMLGLLKYPDGFSKAQGLNQLWQKDTSTTAVIADNAGFKTRQSYLIQSPTAKGTFSFRIPLKHIFGFCEDYDRVVYGLKHTLTLVRKSDDDAIFRAAAADAAKVTLNKISWFVPHVLPADVEKFPLYKHIESKVSLPVAYRTRQCDTITVPQATVFSWRLGVKNAPEKPRWVIVGFQTEKSGDQTKNPAVFDHVNVKNMYVMLNSTRYPAVDYNISFTNQQFSRAYGDASMFGVKYFGMDELISTSNISPVDYKTLYPLLVFDVSKQSEKLKTSVVDVQVRAVFNDVVPAGTQAYAVVLSDKLLTFQSDGSKMSVVY